MMHALIVDDPQVLARLDRLDKILSKSYAYDREEHGVDLTRQTVEERTAAESTRARPRAT